MREAFCDEDLEIISQALATFCDEEIRSICCAETTDGDSDVENTESADERERANLLRFSKVRPIIGDALHALDVITQRGQCFSVVRGLWDRRVFVSSYDGYLRTRLMSLEVLADAIPV